jgi:dolichol-phosphate mannosyltransferase
MTKKLQSKNIYNIGIVIPCFRVSNSLSEIIKKLLKLSFINKAINISNIIIVDDCCPEHSYKSIKTNILKNSRVTLLKNKINLGVGGAVKTGYKFLLKKNIDYVVKVDGDGQMDINHIENFVDHAISKNYQYVKGNRFYNFETIKKMPIIRLIGNAFLSFLNKFSSGYWDIFDPTNGFTLISKETLEKLELDKINNRFFFESDMLFRLGLIKARVRDIPIQAIYENEKSNLKIYKIIIPFLYFHIRNFLKRFVYLYLLRDISVATFEFLVGVPLILFGIFYGSYQWHYYSLINKVAPTGTVLLISLALLFGVQFILGFIHYDVDNNPNKWFSSSM